MVYYSASTEGRQNTAGMDKRQELEGKIRKIVEYTEDRIDKTREFRESIENAEMNGELLDKLEEFVDERNKQQEEARRELDNLQSRTVYEDEESKPTLRATWIIRNDI